ncbi:TRAP transporter small permease [Spiribacter halobius]|uniref:TRAP transporter small permease protein n=1 Tax=Sediminicurvatus halobius TaxID=2182432 RepID=A0A2U2MXQ8_9GAMM|nr:TRAP transporter small permease [Spiribacter halobius]PWG61529.1 TRAP transporter small permease [Spiribacter halobius]UEX78008.1 TRAP transporter small permease [Spiribacter halobius]
MTAVRSKRNTPAEVPAATAGTLRESSDSVGEARGGSVDAELPTHRRLGVVWRVIEVLLFCGVAGMLITVTLQVLARLAPISLPWTEELTRYLFIWTTFLGLAVGTRSAGHARITILLLLAPARVRSWALHVYFAAGCLFFAVLGYTGLRLVLQQIRNGETSPALGIGMYLVTAAVVTGAALALWAQLESVYLDRRTRRYLETGGSDS